MINVYLTKNAARLGAKALMRNGYVVLEIYSTKFEYIVKFTDEAIPQGKIKETTTKITR